MDEDSESSQCTCRSAAINNQVSPNERNGNCKRLSYLSWDDYFMSVAVLSAMRSKDPRTQVGACIVNKDKRIVAVGYIGLPKGCSDNKFPWTNDPEKGLYVCHAEVNAILNRNSYDLKECTLYVAYFPCNECAKMIIQSGITSIFYMSDRDFDKVGTIAAKKMFDAAKVEYREYIPSRGKFTIDFSQINLNQLNQLPPSPNKSEVNSNDVETCCKCQTPLIKSQTPPLCDQFQDILKLSNTTSGKRQSYLSWDDYFMAMAFLSAMRSKDPCTQVGACIVNEDKLVVGIGYNGFPQGCSDDEFPWSKDLPDKLQSKYLYVCHAEVNAILNRNSRDVKNCTLYVALFPCNECAKMIIQSGIKTVFFLSDKHAHKIGTIAAKRMFDAVKVEYRHYMPSNSVMEIDFARFKS